MKKLLKKLFGRKYWIVIARNRFSLHEYCVGHIFARKIDAEVFCDNIQYKLATDYGLEVHSFRSKFDLDTYSNHE